MICPRCGAPIQYGAAVCANCGQPLQWGPAAPQQAPVQPPPGYQGYQQAPYPAQMYQQAPPAGNSKLWLWIALAAVGVIAIIISVVLGTNALSSGKKPTSQPAPAPTTSHVAPTFVPPSVRPLPSINVPSFTPISFPPFSDWTGPTMPIPTAISDGTLIGAWTNILTDDEYQLMEFKSDGKVTVHLLDGTIQTGTYQITEGDVSYGNLTVKVNGKTETDFFVATSSFLVWGTHMFYPYSG